MPHTMQVYYRRCHCLGGKIRYHRSNSHAHIFADIFEDNFIDIVK